MIDLMDVLERTTGCRVTYHEPADGLWGTVPADGMSWDSPNPRLVGIFKEMNEGTRDFVRLQSQKIKAR